MATAVEPKRAVDPSNPSKAFPIPTAEKKEHGGSTAQCCPGIFESVHLFFTQPVFIIYLI